MGCLFLLIAALSPRLALILTWIFTPWVDRATGAFMWPLLGLLFLPITTLLYVILWNTGGYGVEGWEWILVIFGVFADLASYGGSRYGWRDPRARAYERARRRSSAPSSLAAQAEVAANDPPDRARERRPRGSPRSSARLVQQLQELVGCELDLFVTPFRGAVMAGDDPRPMQTAEVAIDECVAGLCVVC